MTHNTRRLIFDILLIILIPLVFMTTLGIYGTVRPRRVLGSSVPENYGLEYENVSFTTRDGIKLAAWYIPRRSGESDVTVIVLHGYPMDKGDLLARSRFLADYFNLLLVDFRYFGQSGGSYTTMGARETKDLLAAVDWLKQVKRTRKIGVYGFSMGGAVALMSLREANGQIDAVVTEASYASLSMMVRDMYRSLGLLGRPLYWSTKLAVSMFLQVNLEKVSPAEAVRGLDTPILVVHSEQDKVISFDNALMIQDALLEDKNAEFLFLEQGNHGDVSVEFAQKMYDFFSKHLK